MNNEIELVIFDNDGVLVDSEIIWHKFFVAEMTRLGNEMSIDQSLKLLSVVNHGTTLEDILIDAFGLSNLKINLTEIGNETEANYPLQLKPVHNIQLILDFIENNKIKKCIASNGDFEYIKRTLNITGLDKYFHDEVIFGVEERSRRKPEPYIFLQAANKWSVPPEKCLVIEDHAFGIMAAKKAHMNVIGFLGATHAQNDVHRNSIVNSKPNRVINDSIELLDLIKQEFNFVIS